MREREDWLGKNCLRTGATVRSWFYPVLHQESGLLVSSLVLLLWFLSAMITALTYSNIWMMHWILGPAERDSR